MSSPISKAAEAARSKTTEAMESSKRLLEKDPAQTKREFLRTPLMRTALPFINGGLAGMSATAVVQPIDMVKVRLQLAGAGARDGPKPTPLSVTRDILKTGKVLDLYTGLSAGLLRQAVYTTARLGFFDTIMGSLTRRSEEAGKKIGFRERAVAGLTAGGLAAVIGNPADLALIRMQSDGLLPPTARKSYSSVLSALTNISRSEGLPGLWAGCSPTVFRAMALNFGQLAFFSEAKSQLNTHASTTLSPMSQTLAASAIAGFFASFFSLPFDFVKTRLQQQGMAKEGRYRGMRDCFFRVAREEGMGRFYRGFGTYYVRIAPHAMVTLLVADWLAFITK